MRKTLLNALLVLFAMTGSATAQTTSFSHSIDLAADVPKVCSFESGPTATTGSDLVASPGVNSTFTVQVDPNTSKVKESDGTLTFANAFCNTASKLTITRQGLSTEDASVNGFTTDIVYNVGFTWGGQSVDMLTNGGNSIEADLGPLIGDLSVQVNIPSADNPLLLLEGQYTDILVINVTPL